MASTNYPQITYDPAGVFLDRTGISREQLLALYPRLEAARREVLEVDQALYQRGGQSGGAIPEEKKPLDHGFLELPDPLKLESAPLDTCNS